MPKKSLVERVSELENIVRDLTNKNKSLENKLQKYKKPHTVHGGANSSYGLAHALKDKKVGPLLPWNNEDLNSQTGEITTPTQAYNEHSHSEWSGGALDVNTVEFVEYDFDAASNNQGPHNQGFWDSKPPIAKAQKENGENVNKKGNLNLVFNPDTETWGAKANSIDVKSTYLVERDGDGNIATDENGNEKIAPLWNSDSTKSAIVWDKNAQVWRFYATFADYQE